MQTLDHPVAYGVILFAIGAGLWHRKWLHRPAMVLFAAALAFFAIGIIPFRDALARLTSTGAGLVVLVIVAFLAILGFAVEMRSKRKDGRHWAHICAGIAAVSGVMIFANGARLLRQAEHSPAQAGHALSQSVRAIQSGQAARAVNTHQSLVDLGLAVLAILILVMLARKHEKKVPAKRAPLAITSGRPGSGSSSARPALPNARGH